MNEANQSSQKTVLYLKGINCASCVTEIEKALVTYNQIELLKKWKKNEVEIDPLLIAILLGKVKTFKKLLPFRIN